MKAKYYLILIVTFMALSYKSQCPIYTFNCPYKPNNYYTFENPISLGFSCTNSSSTLLLGTNTSINQQSSGIVNNYIRLAGNGMGGSYVDLPDDFFTPSGVLPSGGNKHSSEFLFRLNSDRVSEFDFVIRGATLWRYATNSIFFQVADAKGSNTANMIYPQANSGLIGSGKLSMNYFLDQQWHHIACVFDGDIGEIKIAIDGEVIPELTYTYPSIIGSPFDNGNYTSFGDTKISIYGLMTNGSLDIDEVAYYETALTPQIIYQHYQNAMSGNHYDCTPNPNLTVPTPNIYIFDNFNPTDFAPNHPFSSGIPVTADGVSPNQSTNSVPLVIDQFQDYPLPRFKKGHTLNPNINWTDNEYLGRLNGVRNGPNDILIQEELAKNWNYMVNLKQNTMSQSIYQSQMNAFANSHPQYKYSIVTNINETIKSGLSTLPSSLFSSATTNFCPAYINHTVPDNISLALYDDYGNIAASKIQDNIVTGINNNITPLTVPINYVSENGEEDPIFSLNQNGCPYNDPIAISTFNMWTNNFTGTDAWYSYYGESRRKLESAYRDKILNSSNLTTAKFSKYLVSSVYQNSYFEDYYELRSLNTPYIHNGHPQYYSTPPFYIRHPAEWQVPNGGTNWGLKQLISNPFWGSFGRIHEISIGDSLFAPFVSSGWSYEHGGVKPGQWLGLLKALGLAGADFYHTGYFNETVNSLFPTGTTFPVDPKLWCSRLATSSYAQGITTRYEKFLHASNIEDFGFVNSAYFMARKYIGKPKYIIYGTQQKNSNQLGNAPLISTLKIDAVNSIYPYPNNNNDLTNLKFEISQQGNTYYYDNSNPSKPIFYQLDKWHESTHPSYWSKDFNFEAEVHDSPNDFTIATERPLNVAQNDFTVYDSYIQFTPGGPTTSQYIFTPRTSNSYQVWVRLRKRPGSSSISTSAKISISNANVSPFAINCITSTTWQWYGFETCSAQKILLPNLIANQEYTIGVGVNVNFDLEFDKFIITPNLNANIGLPIVCNQCTPTSSDKTICYNKKANLSANGTLSCKNNNTIRWFSDAQLQNQVATGANFTTPALTSTTIYYVAFFNGSCYGPIVPVTVNVTPLPIVNAGSDIYACSTGGLVTLTPNPSGGNWTSNTYLTGNLFNPAITPSNLIVSNLIYNYTDPITSCKNTDVLKIYIVDHANLNSSINGPNNICSNSNESYQLSSTNINYQNIIANAGLVWQFNAVGTQPVNMVGNSANNPVVLSTGNLSNGALGSLHVMYNCSGNLISIGSKSITKKISGCSLNRLTNNEEENVKLDELPSDIMLYPNPTDNSLFISIDESTQVQLDNLCKVIILASDGKIVKYLNLTKDLFLNEYYINISEFSEGLYQLNFTSGSIIKTFKFIKN